VIDEVFCGQAAFDISKFDQKVKAVTGCAIAVRFYQRAHVQARTL
jgi:hypothetical protein